MRILITGITGFAGSHLAEYLLNQTGLEIYGTIRTRSKLDNIEPILPGLNLIECDLRDPFSVRGVLESVRPDRIFHLAAQSFVPTSWKAPEETFQTNVFGQLNIFEALRQIGIPARIQIACSSEEYGLVKPAEIPINEDNPLRPLSPYGVSKVAQDLLGFQYHASYGLHIIRTRAFNHTGPRRGELFVTANFCKQVAEIECGCRQPVIKVGNLNAIRDFTDVRDVVKAYWLSLEDGIPGEVYVIASGRGYSIRELLELILSMSRRKIEIQADPARIRPSDVPVLLGDSCKFRTLTGWSPEIPFEQTIADLLNYWRAKIKEKEAK